MYVYIDGSGSDYRRERITFAAVCMPKEANRHLPGFLFELKKEVYGVDTALHVDPERAMEIRAARILNQHTFQRALKERREEALKHVRLIERIFEELAANKEFKTITVFAVVWPTLDFEPHFPEGFLPNPIRYLLQRVNRLIELEFSKSNRKATIVFDRDLLTMTGKTDRSLLFDFLFHWHNGLDNLQAHLDPTPFFVDSALTPGIELADLIASCIRQCWENNIIPLYLRPRWDRVEERPIEEILNDPFLNSLKRYMNVILAKVKNLKGPGFELYGLYGLKKEDFGVTLEEGREEEGGE